MDALYDEDTLEELNSEVFTLPSMLIDQSAAVAAAERMYANHRAGVRFYSDFRRVTSVAEMMALAQAANPQEESSDETIDDEEAMSST